jgi:putative redox protein
MSAAYHRKHETRGAPEMSGPTTHLSLEWRGGLTFENSDGHPAIRLASTEPGVSTPPQALAYATMACMGMDVVHVVQKGRHTLEALTVRIDADRAETHPRRFVSMRLHFDLAGEIPDQVVERAIALSRKTYCSVWNTLKEDVELTTSFTIRKPDAQPDASS